MTEEEFEAVVEAAVRNLPRRFRGLLDNVIITVKERPTRAQDRRYGRGLMGLYEGVPLAERGQGYSGAMPDKITLFRENLDYGRAGRKAVAARVRHTLLHELAHHFGMDDEELLEKGLY